jgi:hypothetical protein
MVGPGDVLAGRYRLVELLGTGGMAAVYRAVDIRLDRDVAVKLLALGPAPDAAAGERFLREARAMAALSHPAIVAIFDVEWFAPGGEHGPFLVMELVRGGTLADRLDAEGRLPPATVADILAPIASALGAIHAAGLVHRDVKPQNILLGPAGPKLADLGVVRLVDGGVASELTAPETTLGTLRYLAPEVVDGQAAGPPADAFALAVVGFRALTGRLPRPAATLAELVAEAHSPVPLVSAVAPELGRGYDSAFRAALDIDPATRAGVATFSAALQKAVGAAQPASPPTAQPIASTVADAPTQSDDATQGDAPTEAFPTVQVPQVRPPAMGTTAGPRRVGEAPANQPPRVPRAGRPRPSALGGAGLVTVVALAALLVGVLLTRGLGTLGTGATGPSSTAPATPTATVPAPTVSTEPTSDAVASAIAEVRAAIDAARGGADGLKGNEANDLLKSVAEIETAVRKGDLTNAGEKARKVEERVRELIDKHQLGGPAANRLLAAVTALADLLPPA